MSLFAFSMRSGGVLKLGATEFDIFHHHYFHLPGRMLNPLKKKKKRPELIVTLTLMSIKQTQMLILSHF